MDEKKIVVELFEKKNNNFFLKRSCADMQCNILKIQKNWYFRSRNYIKQTPARYMNNLEPFVCINSKFDKNKPFCKKTKKQKKNRENYFTQGINI